MGLVGWGAEVAGCSSGRRPAMALSLRSGRRPRTLSTALAVAGGSGSWLSTSMNRLSQ